MQNKYTADNKDAWVATCTFSSFLMSICLASYGLHEPDIDSLALLSDFTDSFSLLYVCLEFGTGRYSKSQREQLFSPRFQHFTNLQHIQIMRIVTCRNNTVQLFQFAGHLLNKL